ncbi:MAG: YdeI/OmpD-associated family protein [Candidatus Sumerlaeia bacterium]|nr:YdeI/OmpD-associated family protein [Candidatus Sumerlaeia bacterium]
MDQEFRFTGILSLMDMGKYTYRVLYLPEDLKEQLTFEKGNRLRMNASVEGVRLELCWQPQKGGQHYVMLNPEVCKEAGLEVGYEVDFRFRVANPEQVTLPEEFEEALAGDPEVQKLWDQLTPGRKRSLIQLVRCAKTPETRLRKAYELLERVREGDVSVGIKKRGKTAD